MKLLDKNYWKQCYKEEQTGWDIGNVSTPLKEYFDQLEDKTIRILVPGAGRAWEVEYLFKQGFRNIFLLDFAEESVANFQKRCPDFPVANILIEDFFKHDNTYDLIVEQTFLSSFFPSRRVDYAQKIGSLLSPGGKLVGLLFNHHFEFDGPPFGGSLEEYQELFSPGFEILTMETAYNSIKPRKERELFLLLQKKD